MRFTFAASAIAVIASTQTATPEEKDRFNEADEIFRLDEAPKNIPNIYEYSGPTVETNTGATLQAGGKVAYKVQGSGADEYVDVYVTKQVKIDGWLPDYGTSVQLASCTPDYEFNTHECNIFTFESNSNNSEIKEIGIMAYFSEETAELPQLDPPLRLKSNFWDA